MRSTAALALMCLTLGAAAEAQVDRKTIEIATSTGVLVNAQTLGSADDPSGASDLNITTTTIGVDITCYLNARLGIGVFANHIGFSVEAADDTVFFKTSGGAFGGLAKLRFPAGPRSDLFVVGSGGITRATIEGQALVPTSPSGFYWLAGGGVNFWINSHVSVSGGVRYQASTYKDADTGDFNASGLLAGVGFSLYLK